MITLSQTRKVRLVVALLVLLISACSGGPPPKLYLLEPLSGPEQDVVEAAIKPMGLLGVGAVSLPSYAAGTQMASLSPNGRVSQDSEHRWAEEPADAIRRLLANRLREYANTTVLVEPWPRDYSPTARIELVFDRLLREPGGGAEMVGHVQLLSGDGRRLIQSLPFDFVLYGRATANHVFFVAVSQGVDDIAKLTVEALLEAN